jgi:GGDEF domain-containing protein
MTELAATQPVSSVEARFAEMGMPSYTQAIEQINYLAENMPGQFAVLIGDADGLKDVNDGVSHLAGDQIIIETGEALAEQTAHTGFVSLGRRKTRPMDGNSVIDINGHSAPTANHRKGDEFIIVLPGMKAQTEVDEWVTTMQAKLADRGVKITLSGRPHNPGESVSEILTSADRLLKWDKGLRSVTEKTPQQLEAARQIGEIAAANGLSIRELPKVIGFLPFVDYDIDSVKTGSASSGSHRTEPKDPSVLS